MAEMSQKQKDMQLKMKTGEVVGYLDMLSKYIKACYGYVAVGNQTSIQQLQDTTEGMVDLAEKCYKAAKRIK